MVNEFEHATVTEWLPLEKAIEMAHVEAARGVPCNPFTPKELEEYGFPGSQKFADWEKAQKK